MNNNKLNNQRWLAKKRPWSSEWIWWSIKRLRYKLPP